jgi:hypothetical protein
MRNLDTPRRRGRLSWKKKSRSAAALLASESQQLIDCEREDAEHQVRHHF